MWYCLEKKRSVLPHIRSEDAVYSTKLSVDFEAEIGNGLWV